MEEKIYFSNDPKLCGILAKPEKATDKCIILCHGLSGNKDEWGIFTKLADKLSKSFAVFRFDFRGHGESEGRSADMTVSGEEKDLEAAVRLMLGMGYRKFGILGMSFAGGAVSIFTARHQSIVKTAVLWNALIDYSSLFKPKLPWPKKFFGKKGMQKLEKDGFIDVNGFKLGKKLFDEAKSLKPWKELEKSSIPVLFVHGDKDTYVPYEDSVKYSKLLKNAKLATIEGSEHGFTGNEKEVIKLTADFFSETL